MMQPEQLEYISNNSKELVASYVSLGVPYDVAKKCAIKQLRGNIEEVLLIDSVHFVGLKRRIDLLRAQILHIVEL